MRGWVLGFLVACQASGGAPAPGMSTGAPGGSVSGSPAGASPSTGIGTPTGAAPLPADRVDPTWYRHLVEDVLYTHLGDDRGYGPEHDLARDAIAAELAALGLDVALEPFDHQGATYHNVVGTLPGTGGAADVIVVGAHFDSVNNPGADDNASGTALVLEVARVLSAYELDTTVRFALFDREEQGLRGSAAFAADHGAEVRFALTADMIGQDHGGRAIDLFSTGSAGLASAFADAVGVWGGGLEPRVRTGAAFDFSDHASFEAAGVPAIVVIEADYGQNPHYHQPTDAVETDAPYLDYPYVEDTLRSVVGFVADEAGVR